MQLFVTQDVHEEARRSIKDSCTDLFLFTDDREFILMSQTPPSWISLIGEYREWLVPALLFACVNFSKGFFQELGKRCVAKKGEKPGSPKVPKNESNACLVNLVKALCVAQSDGGKPVSIKVGIPIPNSMGEITLRLSPTQEDVVAFELSLFVLNIAQVHQLVLTNNIVPIHGIHLQYSDDYESISITWYDLDHYAQRIISLPLRHSLNGK